MSAVPGSTMSAQFLWNSPVVYVPIASRRIQEILYCPRDRGQRIRSKPESDSVQSEAKRPSSEEKVLAIPRSLISELSKYRNSLRPKEFRFPNPAKSMHDERLIAGSPTSSHQLPSTES